MKREHLSATGAMVVLTTIAMTVAAGCTGEDSAYPGYTEYDNRQALPLSDQSVEQGGDGAQRPTSDFDRAPAPTNRAPAPTNRPPRDLGQGVDQPTSAGHIEEDFTSETNSLEEETAAPTDDLALD